jgi:RNA polymerase sigma factor (sigma-70 family)
MNLAAKSDNELVLVMWEGDEAAFAELIARHDGRVFQVALNTLRGNYDDAQDAIQGARTACWQTIQEHGEPPRCFRDWYLDIVRKRCIDLYKQGRRTADWINYDDVDEAISTQLGRIVEVQNRIHVKSYLLGAIDLLPTKQSRAVRMRLLEQSDYGTIAQELGTTESRARDCVSVGLSNLRQRINPKTLASLAEMA